MQITQAFFWGKHKLQGWLKWCEIVIIFLAVYDRIRSPELLKEKVNKSQSLGLYLQRNKQSCWQVKWRR